MKKRIIDKNAKELETSGCCTSKVDTTQKDGPCCEQPSDESSCCDKNESKSVNSINTGCC